MKRLLLLVAALMLVGIPGYSKTTVTNNSTTLSWDKGLYTATAKSSVSKSKDPLKARKLAFVDARKKAIDSVMYSVGATPINSFKTGSDYLKNPKVKSAVIGFIDKHAKFTQTVVTPNRVYAVIVKAEVPAYGLIRSMLTAANKNQTISKSLDQVNLRIPERMVMAEKSAGDELFEDISQGPYTSVIIDATDLGVERAMSPKIRRNDGSEVWGTVKVDPDYVLEKGIVAYCKTMEDAKKNDRSGDNPLIIQAVGVAGGKFYCDPVIEDDSATRLLDEDQSTHFLDKYNVIFVVGDNKT